MRRTFLNGRGLADTRQLRLDSGDDLNRNYQPSLPDWMNWMIASTRHLRVRIISVHLYLLPWNTHSVVDYGVRVQASCARIVRRRSRPEGHRNSVKYLM